MATLPMEIIKALQKKSFTLRIYSANVTISEGNYGFGHIY